MDISRPDGASPEARGRAIEDDGADSRHDNRPDIEADETVAGVTGTGGAGPGSVAPPPDADWPDPMGGDDEKRELERRTR